MLQHLTNVFFPSRFQGQFRRRSYFEGYYFKIVDPDHELAIAIIPGISYDEQGQSEAFVQLIDGVATHAHYHRYDAQEFKVQDLSNVRRDDAAEAKSDQFGFQIAQNTFSNLGLNINLPELSAQLGFRQNQLWPWKPWSPGAMGPFSFVPGMQCKHAVVSLWHQVSGEVQYPATAQRDARSIELSANAVGYIEKDWGSSFPQSWTWLQSNHLEGETQPCCILVSAGIVPWITGAFEGHIAALWWRGEFYSFTTYNGSRWQQEIINDQIILRFRRGKHKLEIVTPIPTGTAKLAAPQSIGGMSGKVNESLTAKATVNFHIDCELVLNTLAFYVGVEQGDLEKNL